MAKQTGEPLVGHNWNVVWRAQCDQEHWLEWLQYTRFRDAADMQRTHTRCDLAITLIMSRLMC